MLDFKENETFVGTNLPEKYYTVDIGNQNVTDKKINGEGEWKIVKGQAGWEISLKFKPSKDFEGGFDTTVLLDKLEGEDAGFGGNWYIFMWEGEEGGGRYKFMKQLVE